MLHTPKKIFDALKDNKEWIDSLDKRLQDITVETAFKIDYIEPNSRFGLVIYGLFHDEPVALKLVPPNEQKSSDEITYMVESRSPLLNQVLFADRLQGFYIAKKGEKLSGGSIKYVQDVLKSVIHYKENANDKVSYYSEKIERRVNELTRINEITIKRKLLEVQYYYNEVFGKDVHFLLHGDVREDNILLFGGIPLLIDPIGINAPIEFSITRYIEDQIFMSKEKESFNQILDNCLLVFEGSMINKDKIMMALMIDSLLRTSSSVVLHEDKKIINRGLDNYNWLHERLNFRYEV